MKTAVLVVIMAIVTYLIRSIPFTLFRKKIKKGFLKYFFDFIPYAVLGAMTVPYVFNEAKNTACAVVGFITAVVLAFMEKSLITVAIASCFVAYICGFFL